MQFHSTCVIWDIVCLLLFNGGAHNANVLFKHSDAQKSLNLEDFEYVEVCYQMEFSSNQHAIQLNDLAVRNKQNDEITSAHR